MGMSFLEYEAWGGVVGVGGVVVFFFSLLFERDDSNLVQIQGK